MIVRYYVACSTCEQPHTVRIGMGQEVSQRHRFACRGCGEDVEVGLDVDYKNINHRVVLGENAVSCGPAPQAPVVNIDANFLIPADMQGVDMALPRLHQMQAMFKAAMSARAAMGLAPDLPQPALGMQPTRPDFAAEWKQLRTAWSLVRNGQKTLAASCIKKASDELYPGDPLADVPDWIWRLTMRITQPGYEAPFRAAIEGLKQATPSKQFGQLLVHYDANMSVERGTRYFELMKAYFSAYDEFAQVQFVVTSGVNLNENHQATSTNFDATRMFYGNAFEAFVSQIDILAFLNNLAAGRDFDRFEKLTMDEYLKLDKASRVNPFSKNASFAALCTEADNQIRNASHHGGFTFDRATQVIRYRAGKGGKGEERQLRYAEYLARCVRIFMQAMTLFRVELILSNRAGVRPPL